MGSTAGSDQVLERAKRALVDRNFPLSETIGEAVLRSEPTNSEAMLVVGMCAQEMGAPEKAITHFRASLALNPNNYVAMTRLPIVLRQAGHYEEAVVAAQAAHNLWPKKPEILSTLGLCLLAARDAAQAIATFRQAIEVNPTASSLHLHLGTALELVLEDALAADAYRQAIKLDPKSERANTALVLLLVSHGNTVEAVEAAEQATGNLPGSANMHLLYSHALRGVLETEAADKHMNEALRLNPAASAAAGNWLHQEGKFEEANVFFRTALEHDPANVEALTGLAQGTKVSEDDLWLVDRMEQLVESGGLKPPVRVWLHYALGKAYDNLTQYEIAMKHFDTANKLNYHINLASRGFEIEKHRQQLSQITDLFSDEFIARNRNLGNETDLPIFIVGMIRSGTTLTEQMISSHPQVGAAGEQLFWTKEAPRVIDFATGTMNEALLRDRCSTYLEIVRRYAPGMPHITDKMPLNFLWAGLIHIAFPNSRIIHVRRSPLDTCLSIYMTPLAKAPDFAYDKANMVLGYREYLRVMDHWRSVLPPERFYELDYETLVANPEAELRTVIEFCGLEWSDDCLHHELNARTVSTPSAWQVRQPVYRTSVEKWRNYEPWLGALADLVEAG